MIHDWKDAAVMARAKKGAKKLVVNDFWLVANGDWASSKI